MRVLLATDEPDAAHMLTNEFRAHGCEVDLATDARSAVVRATEHQYGAIVLDLAGPDADNLRVCQELRDNGLIAPILMLTPGGAISARIAGLDSGADDCVAKPFAFEELLARVQAKIRRGACPPLPERFYIGPLLFDTRTRLVTTPEGATLQLTHREYSLMEYFARHAEELVSRSMIAEHVWDETYDPFSNVIEVYVARLRRKIEALGCEIFITTRRGAGYMLTVRADVELGVPR